MKLKPRSRFYTKLLLTSAFLLSGSLSLAQLALGQPVTSARAGVEITNTATGSFEGSTSGTSGTVTSNTVTLSVQEVAGILLVPKGTATQPSTTTLATDFSSVTPGPYQGTQGINRGDVVYFDFTITNIGNSPTAIFIPSIATTNGTQRGINVIEVDPDGAVVTNAPTTLNVPVTAGGTDTITLLGATNGYIPVNGTVTVRVAVEVTGLNVGDVTTVILGNTAVANGQNEDYVASADPINRDVFTSDLANGTVIPTTGYAAGVPPNTGYAGAGRGIDQTVETNGAPVNGDAALFRKEASNTITTAITAAIDYGDAPTPFRTVLVPASSYSGSGASHIIDANLKLGTAVTDAEADGQPTINADGDNTNGSTPNDEDGVSVDGGTTFSSTMPPLPSSATTYSVTLRATNTTGSSAFLVGWIDFNQNGLVDAGESAFRNAGSNPIDAIPANTAAANYTLTWTVPAGLAPGLRYARFRLSTDVNVYGNSLTIPVLQPSTPLGIGEVEDYVINRVPGINVIKRITAITNSITNTTTQITDNLVGTPVTIGTGITDHNDSKWPAPKSQYLRGGIACTATGSNCNAGAITGAKPNDLVEYTIYFVSNGTDDLTKVNICDRIPANTTFEPNTYGAGNGILFGWYKNTTGVLPDPANSTLGTTKFALTNGTGDDEGEFFASAALPTLPCGGTGNANGGIVVNIGAATTVPAATASGAPIKSYGFVRFKVKVN
ncbi:MAG: GEVED domain-containing protein [Pseudanabaena sp. CAN_BIN31]|nr:GEVED domain-containing protein [Pseudanabaena sp. CAN_BIN31]